MANFNVSFQVRDDDGQVSTIVIAVPRGTLTLTNITNYAQAMAALIDAVIDGRIEGISATVGIGLPGGLKADPVDYCEVQKGGLLSFSAAGTDYRHSIRIPTLTPSLFVGNAVDDEDADVAALITALVDGWTEPAGPTMQACNLYGMDLDAYLEGTKSFRRK